MQLLKSIKTESIDLVVTDPPYNISQLGKLTTVRGKPTDADFGAWDKWETNEAYFDWVLVWAKELSRVMRSGATAYVFFDRLYATHIAWLIGQATDLRSHSCLVMTKVNPGPHYRKNGYRSAFEFVCWMVKGDGPPKTFNFLSQEEMVNVLPVIGGVVGGKETEHPTEKPLKVMERFIRVSSNPGDWVLDPFAGSGTTLVAAKKHGRRYVGIEQDLRWFEVARERVAKTECELVAPPHEFF